MQNRQNLKKRRDFMQCVRAFFLDHDYLELDTPIRINAPASEDYIDAVEAGDRYLRTSPELHMKRVLAAGYDKIYQLGPCFRANENGRLHREEFTLLEWYQTNADYRDILHETVQLARRCAQALNGSAVSNFGGRQVDWTADWEIIEVDAAFRKYTKHGVLEALKKDVYESLLTEEIEPNLGIGRPTVLIDFPVELGALARVKPENPKLVERWELYAAGVELANCYSELTDYHEQKRRFAKAAELRSSQNRDVYPLDQCYMQALKDKCLPECAGIALGLDRLLMILLDQPDIANVIAFLE